MGTDLKELAARLEEDVSWQKTPFLVTSADYMKMIHFGLKRLYIDTGRASIFGLSIFEDEDETVLIDELPIDEEAYVLLLAKIGFFKKVQTDVNNIVSYSTDALTVTNAHRPYDNIKNTLEDLEQERRILYYKMSRYCLPS